MDESHDSKDEQSSAFMKEEIDRSKVNLFVILIPHAAHRKFLKVILKLTKIFNFSTIVLTKIRSKIKLLYYY
jgi:hypothetical protein